MTILAKAVSFVAESWMAGFERACRQPAAAQDAVLRGLVRAAAGTEWGRKYGFADLRTPEQFRGRVPLTAYEAAASDWHRAFEGARDVTWPGHVRYFAISSGTTAGEKLIPVTAEAIRSNRRAGALLAAFLLRRGPADGLIGGRFMYLGGCTTLRDRGPCLYGDASAIVARHQGALSRRRMLPEAQIAAISNWEGKIDRVVERYLHADVRVLGACPSWAAILFKHLIARAVALGEPRQPVGRLWPRLSHFVSYGMAFPPYLPAFQEYIGRPIQYTDTYSSSEGGMAAIQDEPGGPLRLIVDNGVFYEFIPADRADETDPPRLHMGEVQEGRDYAMVVTTNGGIWAYPLGDVVRFISLRPPRIIFAGRTRINLSAFGEHVTLEMIEKAMAATCRQTQAIVADYTIAPRFPTTQQPKPAHRWFIEFDRPPADLPAFAATLDSSIRGDSEDYDTHRQRDFGLAPPIVIPVASGTFYQWMKRKGKLGGQHKVPRVARGSEMAEELQTISDSRAAAPGAEIHRRGAEAAD